MLLPVYNAAPTLDQTLKSLAVQHLKDFEVVAVDDGSDDDSLEILRVWAGRDPRLRIEALPHRGLVETLNAGLAQCRAPLVARMDADDIAHPDRLGKQACLLENRPEVSVAGCLVDLFPPEAVAEGARLYVEWINGLVEHEDICRDLFVESPIVHPSAMLRRAELLALGGYREYGWPEDYDLWLRYHAVGKRFAKVPETLLSWREHGERLTRTDGRYSTANFLRAKAHYLLAGRLRSYGDYCIWGGGQTGRRLSKYLIDAGRRPAAFVDIDPKKIGRTLRGVEVIDVAELVSRRQEWERPLLLAAVASRGARQLIRARLAELGWREGDDFICVA